jgi:hypothetical protein
LIVLSPPAIGVVNGLWLSAGAREPDSWPVIVLVATR